MAWHGIITCNDMAYTFNNRDTIFSSLLSLNFHERPCLSQSLESLKSVQVNLLYDR